MKKTILLFLTILALAIPHAGIAQRIDSTISEGKFGAITSEFYKVREGDSTNYFVSCYFQNAKYTYITDLGLILIADTSTLSELIRDLEGALTYMGSKTTVRYSKKHYSVIHYDFAPARLYVEDGADRYTSISKKEAESWIAWLKSIEFPQESN